MKNKKYSFIIFTILLIFLLIFATGCSYKLKTNTEYNYYSYEPLKGTFIKNSAKIFFKKTTYSLYNNANVITGYGEYLLDNNVVSLIPDKIGTVDRIAAANSMILYKNYLVDLSESNIMLRMSDKVYGERSELEGVYENDIKLKKEKIYISDDGSNSPNSFIEQIGTYKLNKNEDFITFYLDNMYVQSFLIFSFIDDFGAKIKGLSPVFYCCKEVKFEKTSQNLVEMNQTIFENKSSGETTGNYELALIGYPNNEKISSGVTYRILTPGISASINNNTLEFAGVGAIEIEYSYKQFKNKVWIYIVDFTLKDISDSQRTFNVGDIVSFESIIFAVTNYEKYAFSYFSVQIKNTVKAKTQDGKVEFLETGTVEVILTLRNTKKRADGEYEILELKQTAFLIIV